MKFFRIKGIVLMLSMFVLCLPTQIYAQDPIDPCTDPADPCPIDSGTIYLVLFVFALAIKKYFDFNKTLKKV
jgi:hypothetical protein